jgi:hypothetical protein
MHFLHLIGFWFVRLLVTMIAIGCLVDMFKQLGQPLAPRTVGRRGRVIEKGTLDNVLDAAGAVWGAMMWLGLALVLWLI